MLNPELIPYLNFLPAALAVFITAFLLTPLLGSLAKRYKFIDLPQEQRKRNDKTLATRIHHKAKLRLGGLAVLLPFILVAFTQLDHNPKILGMIGGLFILILGGVLDDKYELSARKQMLIQLAAAIIVVISGVTIPKIDFAGLSFNFSLWAHTFNFGLFNYNFLFPGDFITVFWIMTIINAINWMSGIDAIGELTTFLAALTTMLLSVRSGQLDMALMSASLAAGLLGFIPYNLPPSEIMSGTAGTTGYGFILAVFAVISGTKITSALMLLSIPIIDMIWVMIYRFITIKDVPFLKRPFMGGNVHLHHRLMALGLTQAQTLWLEISVISLISILAFSISGFSDSIVALVVIITLLIVGFTSINLIAKHKKKVQSNKKEAPPQPPMITSDPTPEQKYAY
jgi:UDP-GlcNAc:undecaprenyl-phosphate GlcNAc-1-phosphate transferase